MTPARSETANAVMADIRLDAAPGPIGIPSDATASRAELMERARIRDNIGDELHGMGLTEDARRHWARADHYRTLAEKRS